MEIEIHGYVITIKRMNMGEIKEMISHQLHIDNRLFKSSGFKESVNMVYGFGAIKESVSIRCGSPETDGYYNYIRVTLHGSFFDHSPNFKLQDFISFIEPYGFTPKQLDVAFTDNNKCLLIKDVIRWCGEYNEYCIGTLIRSKKTPEVAYTGNKFKCIELAHSNSMSSFATIYIRPDTEYIRLEIKFKAKDKIGFLLHDYSIDNISLFEKKCLSALVASIDFVTPSSKKKRSPDKYIRQQSWKNFLGSEIKKKVWNELMQRAESSRIEADNFNCNAIIKKTASQLQNMISKLSLLQPEQDIINKLSEYSGYTLTKINASHAPYHK